MLKNEKKKYIENKNSNIATYLMELKNKEYWLAYTGQILCPSPDMENNIREQHDRTKTCSYCQTPGHTKRTCPNIIGLCTSRH